MFGEVADVKPLGCSDLVKMFGEVADVKPLLSGSWDLELEAEHAAALFVVAFFCVKIHKIPVGAVLLPLFPVASTVCQNTNAELQRRPNPQALVKEGSIHSKQNYITLGPRPRPPVVLLPLPCLPAVRLRRLPHPLSTWRRRPRLPRRAGLAACSCTGGGGERPPRPRPAHLPDHQRFCIKGRVYPAILPVPGNQVNGKVFKDLADRELHVFHMFEDEEYVRKTVEVSPTDSTEKLLAYAYVWAKASDPDLYGEWDGILRNGGRYS